MKPSRVVITLFRPRCKRQSEGTCSYVTREATAFEFCLALQQLVYPQIRFAHYQAAVGEERPPRLLIHETIIKVMPITTKNAIARNNIQPQTAYAS